MTEKQFIRLAQSLVLLLVFIFSRSPPPEVRLNPNFCSLGFVKHFSTTYLFSSLNSILNSLVSESFGCPFSLAKS